MRVTKVTRRLARGAALVCPLLPPGAAAPVVRPREAEVPMHPPSDTRSGRLTAALDDFVRSSADVVGAAVVSFDGLVMASALPPDLQEDRVGAMSAALLSLGEQAAMGLGRGQLNQVFVEGEHGFVFLMSAKDQAVLAAVADRQAKIGFMLFEMRRAAERVGDALSVPKEPVADHTSPFGLFHELDTRDAHLS